jgi:hypothetical protein
MSKFNSPGGKVLASSIVGGTASVLGGGKFANGAITGAYVMLFNHMRHPDDGEEDGGKKPETAKNDTNSGDKFDNGIPDALGPVLIIAGQEIIPKSFAALGSGKYTPIASKLFRNIPGKLSFRVFGTRGLGVAIGRFIPALGYIITTIDSWTMMYQSMMDLQTAPLYIKLNIFYRNGYLIRLPVYVPAN